MKKHTLIAAALVAGFGLSAALAQVIPIPQVTSIGASDLFQDVVNGVPNAQSQYASAALLGNYGASLPGNNPENAIIGGDSTTNLYQRGTTGSSVTTLITYGGPDRWAYWSGASTAMTVSQDTTAGDFPAQFKSAFKMARTSGQTGVVQVCMMQEIESANSYAFAGQTAEIDFHATAGANFSAASSNLQVTLISGTGVDQGVSTAAFNFNAGGSGSSTWTGQVNTSVNVPINTVSNRYTVAIPVPAAASELAVVFCFTPVGTAGTNDYVALTGVQLTRNSALTALAGTAGIALPANDTRAKAFSRRPAALETAMQYRYYYRINEVNTAGVVQSPGGQYDTTTTCSIAFPLPSAMRAAPTADLGNLAATTFTIAPGSVASPVVLATTFGKLQVGSTSTTLGAFSFITTTETVHNSCVLLSTAAGAGFFGFIAEL